MADEKRVIEGVSSQDIERVSNLGHGTRNIDVLTDEDVTRLVVVEDNTDEVIARLDIAIARGLEAVGIEAESNAAAICPVDTGRLRNSITHTIDISGKWAIIGTNVEYARVVHEGTSKRAGQPFLRDAAVNHANRYRSILKAALES